MAPLASVDRRAPARPPAEDAAEARRARRAPPAAAGPAPPRAARAPAGPRGAAPRPRRPDARDVPARPVPRGPARRPVPRARRARGAPAELDALLAAVGDRAQDAPDGPLRVRRAHLLGLEVLRALRAARRRPAGRRLRGLRPSAAGRRELLRQLRPRRSRPSEPDADAAGGRRAGRADPRTRLTLPRGQILRSASVAAPPDGDTAHAAARLRRLQEYCLECGERLPATRGRRRRARPARGSAALAWYPGDWIWPVAARAASSRSPRRRRSPRSRARSDDVERRPHDRRPGRDPGDASATTASTLRPATAPATDGTHRADDERRRHRDRRRPAAAAAEPERARRLAGRARAAGRSSSILPVADGAGRRRRAGRGRRSGRGLDGRSASSTRRSTRASTRATSSSSRASTTPRRRRSATCSTRPSARLSGDSRITAPEITPLTATGRRALAGQTTLGRLCNTAANRVGSPAEADRRTINPLLTKLWRELHRSGETDDRRANPPVASTACISTRGRFTGRSRT